MSENQINDDWLTDNYDYAQPKRGEIREGVLLEVDDSGAIVDVGLKHDGIVPRSDIDRLEDETLAHLVPGQTVSTRVIQPQDQEGSLLLSLSYFQEQEDWNKAQELLSGETVWEGEVTGYNRGGILVKFGSLTGFVPASHLWKLSPHHQSDDKRKAAFREYVGQNVLLKVIEANPETNRLVFSERLAQRVQQQAILAELEPGQIRRGVVRHLVSFGAFVDLGGIDGLIHITELAWQRVQHPREVVEVDQEVEVYILQIDRERQRISLSLKELEPNPWELVNEIYELGQLVTGTVTKVVNFGAFVRLDVGVDGLLHRSEIAEPVPDDPREFVEAGDELTLRILRIEPERERISLSLKNLAEENEP